ncbi:MAG TPA: hypothetical protein VKE69_14675 [Planctomycetota bacterium]|nr:hypothetical protein [Planctomycetota bacterium]
MTDLVLVARGPVGDDMAEALRMAGFAAAPRLPLALPKVATTEVDRDAAVERAREEAARAVEALEREIASIGAKVVAFLGMSLYAAAVGARVAFEDDVDEALDRFQRTFRARVRFGGAVAVAIPSPSRAIPVERVVARLRELSLLRAELASA